MMLSDVAKFHSDYVIKMSYADFADWVHQTCVKHYLRNKIMIDVYLFYENHCTRRLISYNKFIKWIENQVQIYEEARENKKEVLL